MAGKRYSRQRELIRAAVQGSREHPTAEMVYQWLKPANPNLSLGTVYRNLNLLAEEGVLIRMPFPVERYDAVTRPHTHFCCEKCGRVMDLDAFDEHASCVAGVDAEAMAAEPEVCIHRHELIFYGLCGPCRGEQEN